MNKSTKLLSNLVTVGFLLIATLVSGQSIDSTYYHLMKNDTSILGMEYYYYAYKNNNLQAEGWVYYPKQDKQEFYPIGDWKKFSKNGYLMLRMNFPVDQDDSIKAIAYRKSGLVSFEMQTTYEKYRQQPKVDKYVYYIDEMFRGWTCVFYRSNGKRYSAGSYNMKGKPIGLWTRYDKEGKVRKTITYDEDGKKLNSVDHRGK